MTNMLQSNTGEKTKEQIENESQMFEELRKKMMKLVEFVEQYDKGGAIIEQLAKILLSKDISKNHSGKPDSRR